jgi:hypothetical protein
MERQKYDTISDALSVARDNSSAIADLRAQGAGHAIVAQVLLIGDKFEMPVVSVRSEAIIAAGIESGGAPHDYVVLRFEDLSMTKDERDNG